MKVSAAPVPAMSAKCEGYGCGIEGKRGAGASGARALMVLVVALVLTRRVRLVALLTSQCVALYHSPTPVVAMTASIIPISGR